MPETRMDTGSSAFSMLLKLVMMFGWQIQPSESGGCGMHMRSAAFVRYIRCAVSFVIRRRVSSLLCVVQKNACGVCGCMHMGWYLLRRYHFTDSVPWQSRRPSFLYPHRWHGELPLAQNPLEKDENRSRPVRWSMSRGGASHAQ